MIADKVATALTVYGIETDIEGAYASVGIDVATALTVYGIETVYKIIFTNFANAS